MARPIAVLDTNIFISAVFWRGDSYRIVQMALDEEIAVFISEDIIKEIRRVLARDFHLSKQEIDDIMHAIALFTQRIAPGEKIGIITEIRCPELSAG